MAADTMAKRVRLRSKFIYLICLLSGLYGCQPHKPETVDIPDVYVPSNNAGWQKREGRLWLKDTLFSGWQYQLGPTGDTLYKASFLQGQAEGYHRQWYDNRKLKEVRQYRNGWQEGEQRGWFESGRPAFQYQFRQDVYDGSRKEWYPNGQPALFGHYHDGQEAGSQQQWFANGTLKVNYVARNGRNYGFTGVKNCVNVWDSVNVSH
ncbi:toxin-antitoxin system YwqK family antitoxin [Spirosoma aerophilum]